jgi:hypothetical protein
MTVEEMLQAVVLAMPTLEVSVVEMLVETWPDQLLFPTEFPHPSFPVFLLRTFLWRRESFL